MHPLTVLAETYICYDLRLAILCIIVQLTLFDQLDEIAAFSQLLLHASHVLLELAASVVELLAEFLALRAI